VQNSNMLSSSSCYCSCCCHRCCRHCPVLLRSLSILLQQSDYCYLNFSFVIIFYFTF